MSTIIFDFDGTIADTLNVMVALYNRFSPAYGCKSVALADLPQLRGEHPRTLMKRYRVRWFVLPFLARRIQRAFHGELAKALPHNGVADALHAVHAAGVTMGILSSNTEANIRAFLAANGIEELFSFVEGHPNVFAKARALRRVLRRRGLSSNDVMYVGDEIRDIEAAKSAHIRVAAVTWGFQTHDALAAARPDMLVNRPEELIALCEA